MSEHDPWCLTERAARALGLPVTTDVEDIERAVRRANELGLNPSAVRVVWQKHILTDILQDLIAELRGLEMYADRMDPMVIMNETIDRAEQRLKEVQGE